MTWNDAQLFCQTKCNSDLASIHSDSDQIKVSQIVQEYFDADTEINVYIGLRYNLTSETFSWSDHSPFIFGSTLKQYPWTNNRPNTPATGECMQIAWWTSNWVDSGCVGLKPFLCNDCPYDNYQELPTYYLSTSRFDIYNARKYCQHCDSEIASIHNERDYQLAVQMAYDQPKYEYSKHSDWQSAHNVLIGLYRNDSTQTLPMSWIDGSPFNGAS